MIWRVYIDNFPTGNKTRNKIHRCHHQLTAYAPKCKNGWWKHAASDVTLVSGQLKSYCTNSMLGYPCISVLSSARLWWYIWMWGWNYINMLVLPHLKKMSFIFSWLIHYLHMLLSFLFSPFSAIFWIMYFRLCAFLYVCIHTTLCMNRRMDVFRSEGWNGHDGGRMNKEADSFSINRWKGNRIRPKMERE